MSKYLRKITKFASFLLSFIGSLFLTKPAYAAIFGQVNPPPGVSRYGGLFSAGPANFISNIIKTIIVIAGLYAVFNLATAGYSFMSAGGDAKKIADAWAKIWQTLIGLIVAVGTFVLAAIFGKLIFGDYDALLKLKVFGP